MAFAITPTAAHPKRVALYLRVSTGRQAEGDVSIPSQRDVTQRFCEAQGWELACEFVEPGASATDDRRPVFRRMLEEASRPDRRFDVICVHAFSRFYRNGAEMELTIRRLRKHGVQVVSMSQPTGDDPSQQLMRQIIGIFDEYTSRENGKNVSRSMHESAKQGFWNGATAPLGYSIVDAEKRGSKIKKKLAVNAVEAELVRLIFTLYAQGIDGAPPLGVKDTTKWLNAKGYRTRKGAAFGVGPLHGILTNQAYGLGICRYGVRNARTKELNDPESVVEITVPTIVPLPLFEAVQAKLTRNNSKVTAPRVVNGPTLLTGLAVCATCGSGMTRTGTQRRDRSYSYYTCAGCHQKGPSVCKGRHIPLAKLDALILDNVKDQLLAPARLEDILCKLVERRNSRDAEVVERRFALEAQRDQTKDKLSRLYRAIEEGVVELDPDLKTRIQSLKQERNLAETAIEQILDTASTRTQITPNRLAAFSTFVRDKLDTGDIHARKAYLRAVVSRIEVGDKNIRIIGEKTALERAVTTTLTGGFPVSGLVRKWCTRNDSNVRPSDS